MFSIKTKSYFWRGYWLGAALVFPVLAVLAYKINLFAVQNYEKLTLYNLENEQVATSVFSNKPLVVNYWATWCGPCIVEFPAFEAARKKAGGTTVFAMISDDDPAKVRRLLRNRHYGFVFLTTRQPLALSVRPVTYFYSADRRRCSKIIGSLDSAEFSARLAGIQQ